MQLQTRKRFNKLTHQIKNKQRLPPLLPPLPPPLLPSLLLLALLL